MKALRAPLMALLLLSTGQCGTVSPALADDPMNVPLESLRVFDYDRTLCNDQWNTCSDYDRTSFQSQFPGRALSELGLYPEAHRLGGLDLDSDDYAPTITPGPAYTEGWLYPYEGRTTEE